MTPDQLRLLWTFLSVGLAFVAWGSWSLWTIAVLFRTVGVQLAATGRDVAVMRIQVSNLIGALQRQKLVTLDPRPKDWSDDHLKTKQAGIAGLTLTPFNLMRPE